jgi:hypothetical protein
MKQSRSSSQKTRRTCGSWISAGEVTEDEDDWFGTPVIEAAPLCAAARSSQTLTTEVVRVLVQSRRRFRLESVGRLSLKGLPVPVAAVQVARDRPLPVPPRPRSHPRRRRAVAAAVVGACVLVGIAAVAKTGGSSSDIEVPAARGYTPRYAATPCPQDVRDKVPDAASAPSPSPRIALDRKAERCSSRFVVHPLGTTTTPGIPPSISVPRTWRLRPSVTIPN